MKYVAIENIWDIDLELLSNSDRGRIYFERSKQVVAEALADPKLRERAVNRKRFRRSYLVEKIGCRPSVTAQNPKIRALLSDTDQKLQKTAKYEGLHCQPISASSTVEAQLRSTIAALTARVKAQELEIAQLSRRLQESNAR